MQRGRSFLETLGRLRSKLPVALVLLLAGCSRVPESVGNYARPGGPVEPWILATPNPVPPGRGPGATTISWETGTDSPGLVYLSINGGKETFFSASQLNTQDMRGIGKGVYEFRLYGVADRSKPLATVKVTRRDR